MKIGSWLNDPEFWFVFSLAVLRSAKDITVSVPDIDYGATAKPAH